MKTITIFAAVSLAVIVTACCPCRRSANTLPLAGTQWSLIQLGTEKIESENFRMTLSPDGTISGIGDCNRFSGTYRSTLPKGSISGKITVGEGLVSTRMMCLNQGLEDRFTKMLLAADSWSIDGQKLMLIDGGDVVAIFEAGK
jgi:heat shock protein HslJ